MRRESRPGGNTETASKTTGCGTAKNTKTARLYGHDRHEPFDAEDRADLAVLEAAAERGYRLSVQCVCCGHWLSSPKSIARGHIGPKCRARMAAV